MASFGRIVNAWLELAEDRARRKIPMTMEDWAKRLDAFLEFDDREILKDSGKIFREARSGACGNRVRKIPDLARQAVRKRFRQGIEGLGRRRPQNK